MGPQPVHNPPRAIGYLRVSTQEQADSGAGLAAQRLTIQAEAERRGWELTFIEDAGYTAKDLNRPGIQRALQLLDSGQVDILCVSKLDRLTRSVHEGTGLIQDANKRGWSVAILDMQVDTSTPQGRFNANIQLSMAELERELIGLRTKEGLAAKKASGVRLGPKRAISEALVHRILTERAQGRSLPAIAAGLEADNIPTARNGKRWYPSTIKAVIDLHELDSTRPADPRF